MHLLVSIRPNYKALQLIGLVQVLIDGGSTHNFIKPHLVQQFKLPIVPSNFFKVMVGNRDNLECTGLMKSIPIAIQGHQFQLDCYIIPTQGINIVLGVQWLELLGPCTMDYKVLTMEFQWNNKCIRLYGNRDSQAQSINQAQFQRIIQTNTTRQYFHIYAITEEKTRT